MAGSHQVPFLGLALGSLRPPVAGLSALEKYGPFPVIDSLKTRRKNTNQKQSYCFRQCRCMFPWFSKEIDLYWNIWVCPFLRVPRLFGGFEGKPNGKPIWRVPEKDTPRLYVCLHQMDRSKDHSRPRRIQAPRPGLRKGQVHPARHGAL